MIITRRVALSLPATADSVTPVSDMIEELGRAINLSESAIRDFQTAAAEACTNTIVHGLGSDPSRLLNVAFSADAERLEMTVLEAGDPFDPEKVKPPDLTSDLADRPIGGLGVYLMKELMDELNFTVEQGIKKLRMVMYVK